jgi:hypothetical protein
MDWIDLVQSRDQWRVLVNIIMNLRVPWHVGKLLNSWKVGRFSRTLSFWHSHRTPSPPCTHTKDWKNNFFYILMFSGPSKWGTRNITERLISSFQYSEGLQVGWRVSILGGGKWFLFHRVGTDSGAHTIVYPIDTGVSFPGVKQQGREADCSHLISRSRMVELYLYSPIHLHGLVLN